jgi:hypothetical protein
MKLRTGLYLALVIPAVALFTGYAENAPAVAASSIKDYAAAHYTELQDDLQHGHGVCLTSLLGLLHTSDDEKDRTIKRMRALSDAYPSLSEFAERVPDLAHHDPPPAVLAAPTASKSDLEKQFAHMKYKTHIHLSMVNGDEIDATFRSFNPSEEMIWVKATNSTGGFDRKSYALRIIKNMSLMP